MFDGIWLVFSVSLQFLRDVLPGGTAIIDETTGEIIKYLYNFKGFEVSLYERAVAIRAKIKGSIHKYYRNGYNDGTFTLQQLRDAVRLFCVDFGIEDATLAHITRIEFGVNFYVKFPKYLIDSAMTYRGKVGRRDCGEKYYSVEWFYDNYYRVKLYKKGPHIVRFEIHIDDLGKFKHLGLNTLMDLCKRERFIACLKHLYEASQKITFVPDDYKKVLPEKLAMELATYKADSFWKKIEDNSDRKYYLRKKIKAIINEYDLIHWDDVLRQRIIQQGALMLGIQEEDLIAMFSELGLQAETVAGAEGDGDRKMAKLPLTKPTSGHSITLPIFDMDAYVLEAGPVGGWLGWGTGMRREGMAEARGPPRRQVLQQQPCLHPVEVRFRRR